MAHATRVVVIDVGELGALFADFQQLVDLFLVFNHRKAHLRVVDREHAFGRHGILVQGDRNRAQGLGGQHGSVQARAVRAHHHQVLAALQPRLVQARRHAQSHVRELRPRQGLPNAIFFFSHRRGLGPLGSVLE